MKISKITIHKALTELKTLDDRINNEIEKDSPAFAITKKVNDKYLGKDNEELEKLIIARYDKINSLIARKNELKKLISVSNATTEKEVAGKKYLIIELINRKDSIKHDLELLGKMKKSLNKAQSDFNKGEAALEQKLQAYLSATFSTNPSKEDIDQETERFNKREKLEIIDPLSLEKKIEKMEEELTEFLNEVDAALSESNAVTFIGEDIEE